MTEQKTEVTRCAMGSKTDNPCPFVATEPIPRRGTDEPEVCAYHAADDPLFEEIDEYAIALEKLEAYLKGARKGSAPVLVKDLERLEADYRARLDWLQDLAKRLKAANKAVVLPR